MKIRLSWIVLLTVFAICILLCQVTSAQTPKPGPEYDKLAGLIGEWNSEGELKENPFGPPEKWTGKVTYEWFPGRFAVVSNQYTKSTVNGQRHEYNVWGYDPATKLYTWYGVDNFGMNFFVPNMSISGDVLIATWDMQVKGKTYKLRATTTGWGTGKVTNIQEYSEDGKVWKQSYRSTETKVTPVGAADSVEQTLAKMEQDWVDASLKKDTAFVDRLLADDYVGIGSDGSVWTKSMQIDVLRTGELKFDSVNIDGIKVRVFGDTAVVTYGQTEKSQYQGKDTSGRTTWTDIYVKRNGKWQLVANHSSRVEEPKK